MISRLFTAVLVSIAAFGCQALPSDEAAGDRTDPLQRFAVNTKEIRPFGDERRGREARENNACAGPVYRWLGQGSHGTCAPTTSNGEWVVGRPFFDLSGPLADICSYDWPLADPPKPDLLPSGLVPDCEALGRAALGFQPSDDDVESTASDAEFDAFAVALQSDFALGLSAPVGPIPNLDGKTTLLAIVDAAPLHSPKRLRGLLQHGNYAERIAELLGGCGNPPCAGFEHRFVQALFPTQDSERVPVGSVFDAALAIHLAVQQSHEKHLVLALGLGFDLCSPDDLTLPAPAAVLYEMLQSAACGRGAIAVAAAGNRLRPDETAAMMYPAKWHDKELFCGGVAQGRSLVVAVSGVDFQGQPLSTSRGLAPWKAAGGPVAFPSTDALGPLSPRSGSSIASATLGAELALAWRFRPALDAQELLDAIAEDVEVQTSGIVKACPALSAVCSHSTPSAPEGDAGCTARISEICAQAGGAPHATADFLQGLSAGTSPTTNATPIVLTSPVAGSCSVIPLRGDPPFPGVWVFPRRSQMAVFGMSVQNSSLSVAFSSVLASAAQTLPSSAGFVQAGLVPPTTLSPEEFQTELGTVTSAQAIWSTNYGQFVTDAVVVQTTE